MMMLPPLMARISGDPVELYSRCIAASSFSVTVVTTSICSPRALSTPAMMPACDGSSMAMTTTSSRRNPDGRPYSRAHVSRVFRRATRRLGLRDFHFHDLRHHGATKALNAGYSAPIVMALGGWKTERMMRRYAAVTDPTLRRAAEALSSRL